MKKTILALALLTIVGSVACNRGSVATKEYQLENGIDSVSYALGMNIGLNLLEKDSLLNVDVLCEAIKDTYLGNAKLNDDEARYAFMKYMNFDVYERTKALENQFLEDLRKGDRKYVATNSGLTYKIIELGDIKKSSRNNRDTMVMNYRIFNVAGEKLDTTHFDKNQVRVTLSQMPRGIQEALRLIGPGGHIMAWVPSALAFSSAGCDSLGVKPNQMLFYEIRLNDIIKR
ncbi:MAG: FKBP-type peptidyl-prolyl cis-trans isomerase [Alistipes sp.]|nr:FKBP-type peptidyl-prolyl cis-trans isomerase [Alistipes sp.]